LTLGRADPRALARHRSSNAREHEVRRSSPSRENKKSVLDPTQVANLVHCALSNHLNSLQLSCLVTPAINHLLYISPIPVILCILSVGATPRSSVSRPSNSNTFSVTRHLY